MRLLIAEHEPAEALALLAADEVDLALVYDYNLAPRGVRPDRLEATPLWTARVGPRRTRRRRPRPPPGAPAVFRRFRDHDWIVNSRNTADERRGPRRSRRWPGSRRGSRTAPTASTWCRT